MGIGGKIKKGLVFIVSAPAGTGKTTLVEMLLKEYPDAMARSVSCTTRAPRKGERPGIDYIFLSKEEFQKKLDAGEFLEHAQLFDHYYGTLKATVAALQSQGKHVFLVIDTQGALYLKDKIQATLIFIAPPHLEALRERMKRRNTESQEEIAVRLKYAEEELKKARYYDCEILNEDLEAAYRELKEFIKKTERERCQYMK